jgi:alpha-mannosidase
MNIMFYALYLNQRWSTHWFKVSIDVPEEWTGERVHFRWNSGSEAMVCRQ